MQSPIENVIEILKREKNGEEKRLHSFIHLAAVSTRPFMDIQFYSNVVLFLFFYLFG